MSSLATAGLKRLGGCAVVWGSVSHINEALKSIPDPVVIAVSPEPEPNGLDDRVTWVQMKPNTADLVTVAIAPGNAEVIHDGLMG